MISSLYAGLCGLLLIYLSGRVIKARYTHRVAIGTGGKEPLERAIRLHANFIEYTPLALLLILMAELQGVHTAILHGLGVCLVAARTLHFLGFRSAEAPGLLRVAGMFLTFFVIGAASLLSIALYLS